MNAIKKLAEEVGGQALGTKSKPLTISSIDWASTANVQELLMMLRLKNGFYAFGSSLHVFTFSGDGIELLEWNRSELWKSAYEFPLPKMLCFAQNIFGEQFALVEGGVGRLDPETGDIEIIASSVNEWCELVFSEPDLVLGYSIGKEWQESHGSLVNGKRLLPKVPFVCGGEFCSSNLSPVDSLKGMKFRANLANQIRDLPDGATIQFEIVE